MSSKKSDLSLVRKRESAWKLPPDFLMSTDAWIERVDLLIFTLLLAREQVHAENLAIRAAVRARVSRMHQAVQGEPQPSKGELKELVRTALDFAHHIPLARAKMFGWGPKDPRLADARLSTARMWITERLPLAKVPDRVLREAAEQWKTKSHRKWPAVAALCGCVGAISPELAMKVAGDNVHDRRKAIESVRVMFEQQKSTDA